MSLRAEEGKSSGNHVFWERHHFSSCGINGYLTSHLTSLQTALSTKAHFRGCGPHAQRARHAALRRESTVIYRYFRKGVQPNTRAPGERNHAAPNTTFIRTFRFRFRDQLGTTFQLFVEARFRGRGPHERRARDAALRHESTAIYRCFRQGVAPNTRALGERNHATSITAFRLS